MVALNSGPAALQSAGQELRLLLRAQLQELGFISASSTVGDAHSLFDSGVLDSLRLMELVSRLEARFGIQVSPDDLAPENFDSLVGMADYLRRQLDHRPV